MPILIADVKDCATSCIVPFGLKNFSNDLPGVVASVLLAVIVPVKLIPSYKDIREPSVTFSTIFKYAWAKPR